MPEIVETFVRKIISSGNSMSQNCVFSEILICLSTLFKVLDCCLFQHWFCFTFEIYSPGILFLTLQPAINLLAVRFALNSKVSNYINICGAAVQHFIVVMTDIHLLKLWSAA